MNRLHHWICRSKRWQKTIEQRVPWVVSNVDLGDDVLEIGPGPGVTTDIFRASVRRLTAVEIDSALASSLRSRLRSTNVRVVTADATALPFADSSFSGGLSFTMLHHVPSPELQDKVLREMFRVLKPGGVFVGSDSLQGLLMRAIHLGDTLVPVHPDSIGKRLTNAGFEVLEVEKDRRAFRFHARKPAIAELS